MDIYYFYNGIQNIINVALKNEDYLLNYEKIIQDPLIFLDFENTKTCIKGGSAPATAAPTAAPAAAPPTADLPLVPLSCPLVALSRYPVGKLTERLPNGSLLNPCPFNGKEHCIIMTIALVSEGHTRDTTIRY